MSSEVSLAVEAFPTVYTAVCFLFHMAPLMTMQCTFMNECFVTGITQAWFLSYVDPLVKKDVSTLPKPVPYYSLSCVFFAVCQTEV